MVYFLYNGQTHFKNLAAFAFFKCSFRNKSREKNTEFSKYIWELKERDIILSIGILLSNLSVTYAFLSSSSLHEQILMFCSINTMSLSRNADIETKFTLKRFKDNLYCSVYVIILVFLF